MKTLRVFALAVVAVLLLASCTTFVSSGFMYSADTLKTKSLGEFRTEVWVNEFLGSAAGSNLFNLSADATDNAIKDAIQREIRNRNGDAAVNVKIVHQASLFNLILNFATGSLYAPGTVIITGTIVTYE